MAYSPFQVKMAKRLNPVPEAGTFHDVPVEEDERTLEMRRNMMRHFPQMYANMKLTDAQKKVDAEYVRQHLTPEVLAEDKAHREMLAEQSRAHRAAQRATPTTSAASAAK